MMKNRLRFGMIGVTLILAMLVATSVQAGRTRTLYLDWRQVVSDKGGDPNLVGSAELNINAGKAKLCYTFRVGIFASLEQPTGAGIYQAPAGSNGPLVAQLVSDFGPLGQPEVSGCAQLSSSQAHDIQRNPSDYYILVTDMDYPDGGARAQLTK